MMRKGLMVRCLFSFHGRSGLRQMSTKTTNIELVKPAEAEGLDIDVLNSNYDIIDDEVGKRPLSVNGETPGVDGDIEIDTVKFADNLTSEDAQANTGEFIIRTSGGAASISDGDAWALKVIGNSVHTGYVAEEINMTVSPMPRDEGDPITATINKATFRSYVATSGTISLTYSTAWSADPASYGITVTGTPIAGDAITVVYVKEVRGTITNATPTALKSTGFNLYNHSAGYAYVCKYSDAYGFKISGTYTSLAFSETLSGEQETITPVSGMFTVPGDGYVWVTGGNATDTCIIATWKDWTDGYEGDFAAYSEATINLSDIMNLRFPSGLMMVGNTRDEIDLNLQVAISRIDKLSYTSENLATVVSAGYEYEYDENYIYYVKETPDTYSISVDGGYTVSDHGMEFFTGSEVPVLIETIYGSNLKNKLERDVLTISQQSLSDSQKEQVRYNIGATSKAAQKRLFSQVDELGKNKVQTLRAYPTEPGVYRVGDPALIEGGGLPYGINGYGTLVIFYAGTYSMHLYLDGGRSLYVGRTTTDAVSPPTIWELVGGNQLVTDKITITPNITGATISSYMAYRTGNTIDISFRLTTSTGGGNITKIATLTYTDSSLAPRKRSRTGGTSAATLPGICTYTNGEIYLYCTNNSWTASSGIDVDLMYTCIG